MTKLREPLTVEHILSQVISKLEENEVKNITNKSFEGKANGKSKDNTNNAHQEYFNKTSKFPEEIKESIKNSSDKFFQELN